MRATVSVPFFHKSLFRRVSASQPSEIGSNKTQLTEQFPNAESRILVADASNVSKEQIADIVSEVRDLHLTVLVDNVGGNPMSKPWQIILSKEWIR